MTPDVAGLYLGMARARLGPAAALLDGSRGAVGACEENRLTRARQTATRGRPELAIRQLLEFLRRSPDEISSIAAVADNDRREWPLDAAAVPVDGHRAHAAYAFHSSPFADALVLVSEVHHPRGWTAWRFRTGQPPEPVGEHIGAYPLARIYGQLAEALGFVPTRDEHLVEALARAGRDRQPRIADQIASTAEGIRVAPTFADDVGALLATGDVESTKKDIAASVQRRLGECLTELLTHLAGLRATTAVPRALCVSGGLFFNTAFTTTAATCGAFEHVHVPAHPGRNGTAIGAALVTGAAETIAAPLVGSPYLGPAYTDAHIKDVLDNCKLSYDLLREERLTDDVLQALARGRLVGWFHGRLEWGPRALGHRSVLASPLAPHTLDNLNGFLKHRPAYRTYGVSVPLASVREWFEGPAESPFMQFEYRPRDPGRFQAILPPGVERLRVQTVDDTQPRFLRLLTRWGEQTGVPVLVNTSFNGFHEPLVCSPRDAIRVFYGTGLDVLALEDFVVRK
jgi:carbamoyltransferase